VWWLRSAAASDEPDYSDAEEDARQAIALAFEQPWCLAELEPRVARFDAAVSALAHAQKR